MHATTAETKSGSSPSGNISLRPTLGYYRVGITLQQRPYSLVQINNLHGLNTNRGLQFIRVIGTLIIFYYTLFVWYIKVLEHQPIQDIKAFTKRLTSPIERHLTEIQSGGHCIRFCSIMDLCYTLLTIVDWELLSGTRASQGRKAWVLYHHEEKRRQYRWRGCQSRGPDF